MESLFARTVPKRGRVFLMLGVSLLVHSGVVGIAALWTAPEPEDHTVIIDELFDTPGQSPSGPSYTPQAVPNESAEPTSTPDVLQKPDPTPPEPTGIPDFLVPSTPAPTPHRTTASRPVSQVHPAATQSISHDVSGQPNGGMQNGPSGGAANVVGAWVMPHPPYPRTLLAARGAGVVGATTVRITTDASGRVSNVVIVKSTGNLALDSATESYVRMNWHGPPNAGRTTEFVYQIK